MIFAKQKIPDIILIKPTVHKDSRGYFMENFRQDLFERGLGHSINFIQDNESRSDKGVLRGLHYQLPPFSQSKLVRVLEGRVLDVAVDIRKSSSTFGQHVSVELTAEKKHQLYVPQGFAHGFVVLSDNATLTYKVDQYYAPHYERGIAFDDAKLGVDWILPIELLKLSEKDKTYPNLSNVIHLFE